MNLFLMRIINHFQEKKQELCQKIQEERTACVNLRVEIRVEEERQRLKKRRQQQQQQQQQRHQPQVH